jgi:RNA polymerase sigma factor (sigma-70 family)
VEDHVQEVFLRLFRKLGALRDGSALRSYIVGITMRVIRSEMRKHAIRSRLWGDYAQRVGYEQLVLQGAAEEEVHRLATILDRVSDKARFVFLMRYVEELSLPEIAESLRVSLATAKRRVRSATDVVLTQAKSDPVLERYLFDAQLGEVDDDESGGTAGTLVRTRSHVELAVPLEQAAKQGLSNPGFGGANAVGFPSQSGELPRVPGNNKSDE